MEMEFVGCIKVKIGQERSFVNRDEEKYEVMGPDFPHFMIPGSPPRGAGNVEDAEK